MTMPWNEAIYNKWVLLYEKMVQVELWLEELIFQKTMNQFVLSTKEFCLHHQLMILRQLSHVGERICKSITVTVNRFAKFSVT